MTLYCVWANKDEKANVYIPSPMFNHKIYLEEIKIICCSFIRKSDQHITVITIRDVFRYYVPNPTHNSKWCVPRIALLAYITFINQPRRIRWFGIFVWVFGGPHLMIVGCRFIKIRWWKIFPIYDVIKLSKRTTC